jgi:hypothetical protein
MKTIRVDVEVKCDDSFDMNKLINDLRSGLFSANVQNSHIEYNEIWYNINESFNES